jgi:erythronate-4-phosphate dehydrogenase
MKKGVWFINSSRGEVVKTSALRMFLGSDKQAGAIIDVWENEPDIDTELLDRIFIATPHIAGYSTDGKANGTAMVVNSLCSYFGLSLKSWYPENIPRPSEPEIVINCNGKSDEDILREAVFHSYNISDDDMMLRSCPADFEKIRGDYRLRREFSSFTLSLRVCSAVVFKKLEGFGFRLVDDK